MYKRILKSIQENTKHNPRVRSIADSYVSSKGLPKIQHGVNDVNVDKDRASKIANAYHNMKHEPNNPEVKNSYNTLINETSDQFKHLKNNGLKISKIKPGMENPYKTSKDLHRDIRDNNHMWFFPTESGFGSDPSQPKDHPMLKPTDHLHEGKPLLANDVFRIVHDYFGHAKEGTQFGPRGEERAWRSHKKMYTPLAQKALTTETRGQNSWVNFGPHGEHNRKNPNQTIYAPQKAGLLPDWAHETGSALKKSEDEFDEQPHHGARKYSYNRDGDPYIKMIKQLNSNKDAIKNRQSHFIFSAENPKYPEHNKLKMSHNEVLDFLKDRGYHAEPLHGRYDNQEENSIVVHSPPKHAINHLLNLSSKLGQESSIYSNGYNHELHFHHGENAGKHIKGQGTHHHKKEPEDNYSKTQNGTIFTHSLNYNELHQPNTSMVNIKPEKINKSENYNRPILIKNEEEKHPLETASSETKLIHYSPKEGLSTIDPHYHGVRGIGEEAKQGKPEHPMSFFYLEGAEPENVVTTNAKSKYVTSKGDMKFYDVGKDPKGIHARLRSQTMGNQINPGIVDRADYHKAIKDAGYHGIYNSSLGPTMRNAVGIFHRVPVEQEHKMHRNDYKKVSAENHHEHDNNLKQAKQNGYHDPRFLANLYRDLKDNK